MPSASEHIEIADQRVPVEVVKSPSGRIRLSFPWPKPVLRVETPHGKLDASVHRFLQEKSSWIKKHYLRQNGLSAAREDFFHKLKAGEVSLMGEVHQLQYQPARHRRVRKEGNRIIISMLEGDQPESLQYSALRALAKNHLKRRTLELARQTHSSINQVRIKDVKSKWGSCSSKRNINLNWYLVFLPADLIDYVIIHELMHLRQMNHSPAYWAEVKKYVPDYQQKIKRVKAFDWVIGLFNAV
jgi:predicted metal-dependent hydrolase